MDCPDASPRITVTIPQAEKPTKKATKLGKCRYSVLVAEHPFIVFFATLLVVFICSLCNFVPLFGAPEFPDFSTPVMGFEARGSTINKRWRTRLFLGYATQRDMFSPVPPIQTIANTPVMHAVLQTCPNLNFTIIRSRIKRQVELRSSGGEKKYRIKRDGSDTLRMCDSPNVYMKSHIDYKTIYGAKDGGNLMTADRLRAICRLESKVMRSFPDFDQRCYKRNITVFGVIKEKCCPSWSLGNYIAALSERPSCEDVKEEDVTAMIHRLRRCSRLFNNGTLKENCWDYNNAAPYPYCVGIPTECIRYNAVFNILYYLTDKDFYGTNGKEKLTYAQVLTARRQRQRYSKKIFDTYIEHKVMQDGDVQLVASDFGYFKFYMFNKKILGDLIYPSIALVFILIIMWFYTESLLLTVLLSVSVISALILAYFVYMIVLRLEFFPFLNVTTLIFLVGIGADDAFVYTDVWRQAKKEHPGACLTQVTAYTLRHASLSMFVTSLTTAGAFIANFCSEITTIKLFGLYAGVAILAKFFLMVTWFPAVCVINDIYCTRNWCLQPSSTQMDKTAEQHWLSKCLANYGKTFTKCSRYIFDDFLPKLVIRFRYIWIALFSSLTVLGLFVLVGYPGFQLPNSSDFQVFSASHPLETYDLSFKDKFRFELSPAQESATFPIDLFWGIEPKDYGDQLNPYSYGKFGWDPKFNIVNAASQKWLLDFCQRIRKQDFYAEKLGSEKKCFIEVYYNQSCSDPLLPELCNYPCCKNATFPFSKNVLNYCAVSSAYRRKILKYKVQDTTIGSFIYDPSGSLIGIWIRIRSNVRLTKAYEPVHQFWKRIESWVKREMKTAPPGMDKGWFISDLEFYNLQQSLSRGTLFSLSISIATAFAVMVLTTMNVFVSLYAILTIIGIISVTIGSLVLSGWKLNIIESITMSVAVGVSIDFSMHFGVAYCLAPDKYSRVSRVRYSLSRMGSAISMAAVTTFLAGAFMMPSDVLSYIQMGHFLMLVMTVSWFFSVFFFQSLCVTIGPQGDMGQLNLNRLLHWLPCRQKSDIDQQGKPWDVQSIDEKVTEFDNIDENREKSEQGGMENDLCDKHLEHNISQTRV